MKTKTLLLSLFSVLVIWGCEQDSSLSPINGDSAESIIEIPEKALSASSGGALTNKCIFYNVDYDRSTGIFTLYYLPRDVFGNISGGGETGKGGSTSGKPGVNVPPIKAGNTPPTKQSLNYILDIYVTSGNKIIYPPVLLPYFNNADSAPFQDTEMESKEQYFERNQYSDVFQNAKKSEFIVLKRNPLETNVDNTSKTIDPEYGEDNKYENTIFYIIKDEKVYFHIDPSSSIFSNDVFIVNKGKFHIATYSACWTTPVCNNSSYILPIITYDINITLKLIKGNPPITIDETTTPTKLYNIFIHDQAVHAIPLGNTNCHLASYQEVYYNSSYHVKQDGSITILNSSGEKIAEYPSSYRIIVANEEYKVMEP